MTTLQSVQAILKANFDLAPETLQSDTKLEDLDIDSLAVLEIMFAVEDEFKVTVAAEPAAIWSPMSTSSGPSSIPRRRAQKRHLETGSGHRYRRNFATRKRSERILH